ncbi:hypothetical protein FQN50_002157 [Emmonsiellopsis sp. PD_5]|nr:hypothetical protein FQN50_002157 [Emmonsiellopsis sp. PD_5]
METQDDSLDLDYWRQAALGLIEEPPNQVSSLDVSVFAKSLQTEVGFPANETRRGLLDNDDGLPVPRETAAPTGTSNRLQLEAADFYIAIPTKKRHDPALNTSSDRPPSQSDAGQNTIHESPIKKMASATGSMPSDTQPISQSVFESFMSRKSHQQIPKDTQGDDGDYGERDVTLNEGDTGHVDLLASFGETPVANHPFIIDDEDDPDDMDVDVDGGISSPTQYQHFPESQRFVNRTPATQNRLTSQPEVSTTPILSRNPFASGEGQGASVIMGLSQVFNATQAPSSPFVNGHQSEFSSDMPSPNLPVETRLTGTTTMFSPFLPSSITRSRYIEPQTNYVSMKESQAAREKRAKLHSTDAIGSSDDEFEKDGSFIQRHAREKYTDQEVKKQFASVTAPARSKSRGRGRPRKNVAEHSSPVTAPARSKSRGRGRPRKSLTEHSSPVTAPARSKSRGRGRPRKNLAEHSSPVPESRNGRTRVTRTTRSTTSNVEVVENPNVVGVSEEETEQEDEQKASQNRRLRQPQSTGEDDKENVDSGPILVADTTASAHDALSQVLEMEDPANQHSSFAGVPSSSSQQSSKRRQSATDENETPAGSQDITILNSQPSVHSSQGQRRRGRPRSKKPIAQHEQAPDVECVPSSPLPVQQNQGTLRPHESPHLEPSSYQSNYTAKTHIDPEESHPGPNLPEKIDSNKEASRSPKEVSQIQSKPSGTDPSSGDTDNPIKISSMPSRVFETPTQNRKTSNGHRHTIPETSPSDQQSAFKLFSKPDLPSNPGSSASPARDDDHLPFAPQLSRTELSQRLQAPGSLSKGVQNRIVSAILSSPSGRQRRSMTEIAADQSPCQSLPDMLPDFGLITAEDREFEFVTRGLDFRSQKRRRGNDGRVISTSTPINTNPTPEKLPTISQPETREDETTTEAPEPATPVPEVRSSDVQRGHKFLPRRAMNVWEVECSPEQRPNPKPKARGRKSRLSQPTNVQDPVARTQFPKQLRHSIAGTVDSCKPKSPSPTPTELIERSDSPDPIQSNGTPSQTRGGAITPSSGDELLTNKIFAFFNGRPLGYFPATCVGMSNALGPPRYLVRFEDSSKPDEVNIDAVKRLELKIGDMVKVDLLEVPKVPHVVVGFKKLDEAAARNCDVTPTTDIHGHHFVILRPKGSIPSRHKSCDITVPISNVYFDKVLWRRFQNRQFNYSAPPLSMSASRLQTPFDNGPSSALSASRTPHRSRTSSGIFSGMAFAISYKDKETTKLRIEELIIQNGGRILKDGFTELFDQASSHASTFTSSEINPTISIESSTASHLSLLPDAEHMGFVCLLTDEHTRRVKYMQALALNIPCLAGRWIHDCIAKNAVVDWEPYLLPAGESTFLNGAIRSRILSPNPASTARLPDTIDARPKMLAGQSVLLVLDRGKTAEQRKPYSFLTCALGPSRIGRVQDINAAIKLLAPPDQESPSSSAITVDVDDSDTTNPGWDWIYVGDEKAAGAARVQLVKATQPKQRSRGRSKKPRPQGSRLSAAGMGETGINGDSTDGGEIYVNGRRVRILDNEFICQSLILGRLFEN